MNAYVLAGNQEANIGRGVSVLCDSESLCAGRVSQPMNYGRVGGKEGEDEVELEAGQQQPVLISTSAVCCALLA